MKTKTKGLIVAVFFAVILITSTLTLALNSQPQQNPMEANTVTGTPADNFPDIQRPRFCGTGDAKLTQYVTEYKIPTVCTQPLAITSDPQGNVWFAQTNTGKITKFDPSNLRFTEYDNPEWPEKGRSMVWGMDYSFDGNIWYTDDTLDSIWRFSTSDGTYERINYPSTDNSLPQHIKVTGSQIIVNDFNGGKLSFYDTKQTGEKIYKNIPSPLPGSFVAGFDVDSQGNVWYTNWLLRQGGALVKFDYDEFSSTDSSDNSTALKFSDAFNLPSSLGTPLGLSVDDNDNIWLADTTSSSFYKFDPTREEFTKYVTSDARQATYGNATGVIKSPITGPYWTQIDNGKLVINEQIGNAIGVFDIESESLVEYQIPSQNPNWSDCGQQSQCGIAQVLGFRSTGDKIWFTEWAENNIGVVDTVQKLPLDLSVSQKQITISPGQTAQLDLIITPNMQTDVDVFSKNTSDFKEITVSLAEFKELSVKLSTEPQTIPVTITTKESTLSGQYKVLLSARTSDVTISEYITVNVT